MDVVHGAENLIYYRINIGILITAFWNTFSNKTQKE